MMATALSRRLRATNAEIMSAIIGAAAASPEFLRRVRSRWPAIMLAANRTDNVIGRIKDLTTSIRTINGKSRFGVPTGTKCANIALGCFHHLVIMCPSHRGKANETEKTRCLEDGKQKGRRPKKLTIKI